MHKTLISSLLLLVFIIPPTAGAQIIHSVSTATSDRTINTQLICIDLTGNLVIGIDDENDPNGPVNKLQAFLMATNHLDLSDTNNKTTGYFGKLTKEAVIKFQKTQGIEPAAGYVGAITRAKIKELSCATKSATTSTTGTTPSNTSTTAYNNNPGWWLQPTPTGVAVSTPNNPVTTNSSTTPAGPHAALVDINAAPTDVTLDANGWPKYLNVPADCPAADRTKQYVHHWNALPSHGNGAPRVPESAGSPFLAAAPFSFINITADKVFAVPFFMPHGLSGSSELRNYAMGDSFAGEVTQYPQTGLTESVHRCPGQFGSEGSAKLFVAPPIEEGIKVYGRFAVDEGQEVNITPGRWYFYNMADTEGLCEATVSEQEAAIRTYGQPVPDPNRGVGDPGPRYIASRDSKGKAVCSLLAPNYNAQNLPSHIAPATGGGSKSGANGKTYYAPNYSSYKELKSPIPATFRKITRCYDATKRLPMAEMIKEYSFGAYPKVIKALGTSWNTYACEHEVVGITQNCPVQSASSAARGIPKAPCRDISSPVPVSNWVCAAHREGQTRQLVITYAPAAPMAVEECKWNEERHAYAWHATYAANYLLRDGTPNWGTYVKWIEGGTPIR